MVPTEVLAASIMNPCAAFWKKTASLMPVPYCCEEAVRRKKKREIYEQTASGKAKMIIGTHALIQEKVEYDRLALVITDEQHRFGVRQRTLLAEKGDPPNVLVIERHAYSENSCHYSLWRSGYFRAAGAAVQAAAH